MLAAKGCIDALGKVGKLGDAGEFEIGKAAAEWAERHEAWDGTDEHQKWADEWSQATVHSAGWHTLQGKAYELIPGYRLEEARVEFASVPLPSADKRRLLTIEDIEDLPDPRWLIHGLVPEQSLAIIYGPPKNGKTFIALSMALHIAAGIPWFGRGVQQGGVVYIAGEGAGGLKLRVRAARAHYGIPAHIPLWVLPRAVNFSDKHAVEDLEQLIGETVGDQPVRWVVIDTLARAMPGVDENSAGEVGKVIAACDLLKERLGCTVTPVHHQGKDGEKGMRGSSALDGAVDALLHTIRKKENDTDIITLATKYQKDAEEAEPIHFDLLTVAATECRTSLVPVLRTGPEPSAKKLTDQQQAALDILKGLVAANCGAPVTEMAWRDACVNGRRMSASENPKVRKDAFRNNFELLQRVGLVVWEDGIVRLSNEAESRAEQNLAESLPSGEGRVADFMPNSANSASLQGRYVAAEAESLYRDSANLPPDAPKRSAGEWTPEQLAVLN